MGLFGNAFTRSLTPTLNALAQPAPLVRQPVPAQQQMRAYHPTPADRARNALAAVLQRTGQMPGEARRTAELATSFTPVGMVEGVNNGLLAAGRGVRDGSVKHTLGGLLEAALSAGPGGTAKGMFLGIAARNADRIALRKAEEMVAKGADRQAIWDATGWFKGNDGKWRFEIDDSASRLSPIAQDKMSLAAMRGEQVPLNEVMHHPSAYEQVPSLSSVGASNPDLSLLGLKGGYDDKNSQIMVDQGMPLGDILSTILHEGQHHVQGVEGFARGGNAFTTVEREVADLHNKKIGMFKSGVTSQLDDWMNSPAVRKLNRSHNETMRMAPAEIMTPALREYLDIDNQIAALGQEGLKGYRRLAGEVEARNVQKRLSMTADQRRATAPWLTQDVPDDQQIIRFK